MPARTATQRLGGELPANADRVGPPRRWQSSWLAFSHGRAALAWLLERAPARSALACAYTCPDVPAFLRARSLPLDLFDVGASASDIAALAARLPAPRLVLLPALFGGAPWVDAAALGGDDLVVIDAAQSAFGHEEFAPPDGGAVFSCPRKSTALADGAVLALSEGFGAPADIRHLPVAADAAALKAEARALWASGDAALESRALERNRRSEQSWPDAPHRMSDASYRALETLDRQWHVEHRRANRDALAQALSGVVPLWSVRSGTPFSLPVFVDDPAGVLRHLHGERIFATALWPDADHDPARHPAAAWMARHLVSLPVDQRHDAADMARVAAALRACAKAPRERVPEMLKDFVR